MSSSSSASLPSPAAPRFTPNLATACGGVWRLTWRRFMTPTPWLVLAGGLALLALIEFAHIREGRTARFYNWSTDFYLSFLVPIFAFLSGAGAIRDEMKSATTDYVLIRPVPRPAFVVFKFLSHLACLQIAFLLALGVVCGVASYRHIAELGAALPWLLLAQAVTIAAFTAFGFLCGVLTSKYFVLGLGYAFIVEAGIGNIPTQLNRISMLRQVNALLHSVLPGARPAADAPSPWLTVGILLVFGAVMVAVTAAVMAVRELAAAPTKDS